MNDEDKIELAFLRFHSDNPKVYEEVRDISLEISRSGKEFYGMKAVFEVVRYHRTIKTNDPSFKLNNNYTALYSRMLMEREPELAGFFKIRQRGVTECS